MAGTGRFAFSGDNQNATKAALNAAIYVTIDKLGNIYIADTMNDRIRFVTKRTGIITTVAGTGVRGYNGDNILATKAQLDRPSAVAIDVIGNLYISDTYNNRIRLVTKSSGIITTMAGNGNPLFGGDNILATLSSVNISYGLVPDAAGNLYITDSGANRIRLITGSSGIITTIAGDGVKGYNGDNIPAISASLSFSSGINLDEEENLYIADFDNHRIRLITKSTGIITTVAGTGVGGYNGDNILATSAFLNYPADVILDIGGNLYIADSENHRIRLVTTNTGIITTIVGTGVRGYNGDNILATSAFLNAPNGIVIDKFGLMYITDLVNSRIRAVTLWTTQPTKAPTSMPSTSMPSAVPTSMPSAVPTSMPSAVPTSMPSAVPTSMPSAVPTSMPSAVPTSMPSAVPTSMPSAVPTLIVSVFVSAKPFCDEVDGDDSDEDEAKDRKCGSHKKCKKPSSKPSQCYPMKPTYQPTKYPTKMPTKIPTSSPSPRKKTTKPTVKVAGYVTRVDDISEAVN